MQIKKRIFLLTFFFSALSLTSAVQFFLAYNYSGNATASLLFNLSVGVFSSSLLGCTMSLTEYFVMRKDALELFFEEAARATDTLKQIQYFDVDAPLELVQACFGEMQKQNSFLNDGSPEQQKQRLCDWYLSTLPDSVQTSDRFLNDWSWDDWYFEKMDTYDSRLLSCFYSIIDVAEMDLTKLHKAYGRFDFFINKIYRDKRITPIYTLIIDANRKAIESSVHFKRCLSAPNGNKYVNIWFLMQTYEHWFYEETHPFHDQVKVAVFFKLYDDLNQQLEAYRCKIYGLKMQEYTPQPIFSALHKADIAEEKILQKK